MGFIKDFQQLYLSTPQIHNWTRQSTNCEYGDIIVVSKNSYLCFNCSNLENCFYCYFSRHNVDCSDLMFCDHCSLCFDCTDCLRCYNSNNMEWSEGCTDCAYCYNGKSLSDCFGCVNMSHAQYCIFNEKYTREEYERKVKVIKSWPQAKIDKELQELKYKHPRVYMHQNMTENCFGDYVINSKNCYYIFDSNGCEDCMYITDTVLEKGCKDSADCGPIGNTLEQCYDCAYCGYLFDCKHIYWADYIKQCEWCINLWDSEFCFGCVYGKNWKYRVLNKEYEPEEWKKKVAEAKRELLEAGIKDLYDLVGDGIHG